MTLHLVRHGEVAVAKGLVIGHCDPPLSRTGAGRIGSLGRSWQGPPPVRIFTSDLARAVDSAGILAARWGSELCVDARLRELSFGDWEGRSWAEVYRRDRRRFEIWAAEWWGVAPPGGETFAELAARLLGWWGEQDAQGAVVAITHGGCVRALLARLLGAADRTAFDFEIAPAHVSALETGDGRCRLLFHDRRHW